MRLKPRTGTRRIAALGRHHIHAFAVVTTPPSVTSRQPAHLGGAHRAARRVLRACLEDDAVADIEFGRTPQPTGNIGSCRADGSGALHLLLIFVAIKATEQPLAPAVDRARISRDSHFSTRNRPPLQIQHHRRDRERLTLPRAAGRSQPDDAVRWPQALARRHRQALAVRIRVIHLGNQPLRLFRCPRQLERGAQRAVHIECQRASAHRHFDVLRGAAVLATVLTVSGQTAHTFGNLRSREIELLVAGHADGRRLGAPTHRDRGAARSTTGQIGDHRVRLHGLDRDQRCGRQLQPRTHRRQAELADLERARVFSRLRLANLVAHLEAVIT